MRGRRDSCLPRWTVCPTRSPSLGMNRSTCRGECSWSGPLVTPPGRCHRGPLTNGPGRIPPYCVCSGGAFSSRPPFRLVVCGGVLPLPGGVAVVGGGPLPFLAVLLACVPPPPPVAAGAPLPPLAVGPLVLVGGGPSPLLSVGSGWAGFPSLPLAVGLGCGPPPFLAGGPLVLVVGGPSPLLAEGPGGGSPFPASPGRGPPVLVGGWAFAPPGCGPPVCGVWSLASGCGFRVGASSPLPAEGPGCGPPPLLDGACLCWWWPFPWGSVGVFRVACVCGAARAGVCAVCLWRWCGCGCVFRVCWRVCGGAWPFVFLAGACCWCLCGWGCGWCVGGPSPLLAEVPACASPPLLAGLRRRWWWALLATPG